MLWKDRSMGPPYVRGGEGGAVKLVDCLPMEAGLEGELNQFVFGCFECLMVVGYQEEVKNKVRTKNTGIKALAPRVGWEHTE